MSDQPEGIDHGPILRRCAPKTLDALERMNASPPRFVAGDYPAMQLERLLKALADDGWTVTEPEGAEHLIEHDEP